MFNEMVLVSFSFSSLKMEAARLPNTLFTNQHSTVFQNNFILINTAVRASNIIQLACKDWGKSLDLIWSESLANTKQEHYILDLRRNTKRAYSPIRINTILTTTFTLVYP